jgi:hypothetical protein
MLDHEKLLIPEAIDELTSELKKFFNETRSKLKGSERREFMANVVLLLGRGGQSRAERDRPRRSKPCGTRIGLGPQNHRQRDQRAKERYPLYR